MLVIILIYYLFISNLTIHKKDDIYITSYLFQKNILKKLDIHPTFEDILKQFTAKNYLFFKKTSFINLIISLISSNIFIKHILH